MKPRMPFTRFGRLILTLSFLLLAGCAAPAATGGEPASPETGISVADTATLIEALRAKELDITLGADLDSTLFGVPGKIVTVSGADVQVFEFPDTESASAAAATVNSTGDQIGTTMVTWIAPVSIYHRERVIVVYAGTNPDVTTRLSELLGSPIAGG